MGEFAELLGTEQSTISRYESGQFPPSRTVLTLLYLLASKDERPAILKEMGDVSDALKQFQNAGESLKLLEKPDKHRKEFMEASRDLLASKEPLEPALIEIVKLSSNKKVRAALAHFLPYFQFLAK